MRSGWIYGTVLTMGVSVVSPVLIGRRDEMASLAALLGRAQAREPAFALVGGEAGVGKTRLVREISAQAAEAGFMVLTGQCVELGAEGLPLAPLVDALRTLTRSLRPETLAEVLGPAGLGLARLLPELAPAAGAAGTAGHATQFPGSPPALRPGRGRRASRTRARSAGPRGPGRPGKCGSRLHDGSGTGGTTARGGRRPPRGPPRPPTRCRSRSDT